MSAASKTIDRPDSFVMPPFPVRRFTVSEYRSLVESGVLQEDDRIELLEGWIVPKVTHNPPHDWTVTQIAQRVAPLLGADWLVRVQCAVSTIDSEPEPDIAVVRTPNDRYLNRHPCGQDIGLLIEVAETSLDQDRRKAAIYAAEGIPAYWIINLIDRQSEVHTRPDPPNRTYQECRVLKPGATIDVELDGRTVGQIPVDDVLPPASP